MDRFVSLTRFRGQMRGSGTRRGDFWTFAASREKQVLSRVEFGAPIAATAVAANGALYISTAKNLYSIQRKPE